MKDFLQRIEKLSPKHLALLAVDQQRRLESLERSLREPVAIVGIGCRFPGGADGPDSFWDLLLSGRDAITEIPPDRWDVDAFYDPDPDAPGKVATRCGGFLADVDQFDAEFFGISRREANTMDPQQRMLLEVSWEALERAGISPRGLAGSRTGIYFGLSTADYHHLLVKAGLAAIDGYTATGSAHSVAAGRIAYLLGLHGPNLAVDTACSSSLVALHLACQALRAGECELALAGGANLILSPETSIALSRARMLSPDGRCKSFDAAADGFVRSEGCGVVALKLLSRAVEDRDNIVAVIRGSAINQDGRSSGLTAPNGAAQESVIRQAMQAAGVKPSAISYIEAHGTGTALGDPIEAHALAAVFGPDRAPDDTLYVGSVKSNIGHLESAAGIAGVIKAALALQHGIIPANLHFARLNPHIDLDGTPLAVPVDALSWPSSAPARMAGVSSFGFSGTNGHVILEGPPQAAVAVKEHRDRHTLVLSARTPEALRTLAQKYDAYLTDHANVSLHDFCYTANTGRSRFETTHALSAATAAELRDKLALIGRGAEVLNELDAPAYASGNKLALPTYPFEKQRYWYCKREAASAPGFYRLDWDEKPVIEKSAAPSLSIQGMAQELAPQFSSLRREHGLDEFAELQPEMDRLSFEFIVRALLAMGWQPERGDRFGTEDFAARLGVKPRYWRSFGRLLEIVAEDGLLERQPEGWAVRCLPRAADPTSDCELLKSAYPQFRGELVFLQRCGMELARALQGAVDPLNLLFPEGSFDTAEDLYEKSAGALVFQTLVAQSVAGAVKCFPTGRRIRILEIGAGTGGTATYVARVLDPARTEYVFTDVSPLFAARAAEKFRQYPFFRFEVLDIERDPETQGFAAHSFDIVIASNSLHATTDLRRSVRHAVKLLAPGGMIVLLEGTHSERWVDISFGLTEGWWKFVDTDLRSTYPLVSREAWRGILADAGCREMEAVPADSSSQQVLLLARGPEAEIASQAWAFVAGNKKIATAISAQMAEQGHTAMIVEPDDITVGAFNGVVDLRGLDSEHSGCEQLLELCRAAKGSRSRVWAVTQGAQHVLGEDVISPHAAPIWGLGRSTGLEQPDVWGGLIDLDPHASAEEQAGIIVGELLSSDGEDQTAFRSGRRYVPRLRRVERPTQTAIQLRSDASYLVTGGLGGLGLLVARWMAEKGARRLILVGRDGVTRQSQSAAIAAIERLGASVRVVEADLADPPQAESLFAGLAGEPPLRGVIHAAAVLGRNTVDEMSIDHLRDILRPKIAGTWLLHQHTRAMDLDFFCLFSSTASWLGSGGMGHYAAANQFLDSFAHFRRQLGLPATAIAWGTWEEMRTASAEDRRQYQALGMLPMRSSDALAALGDLLAASPEPVIMAAAVNWPTLKAVFEARRKRPLLERIGEAAKRVSKAAPPAADASRWAGLPPTERENRLREAIWEETCRVLQIENAGPMELDRGFFEMGMDSLVSVELKSRLEARLGLTLPSMMTFNFPNVRALAARVAAEVALPQAAAPPEENEDEVARMLADKLRHMHKQGVLSST